KTDATCNATSTGSVTAGAVNNAVGTITYIWKNSANVEVGTTATINNLPVGVYTLTVTDDCFIRTNTVTIAEPAALTLAISTKTDATCNATSTGSVTAGAINNAVGVLTYSWKNSANVEVGTTVTVNNLPADTYTLTVTDDCFTRTNTVTIAEPAALTLAPSTKTDATCNSTSTGSVTAGAVNNAVGVLTYSWKNSANVEVGTTANVNNLPADTYTLTVIDNCFTRTNTVTIAEPAALTLAPSTKTDATCNATSTGSVTAGAINNAVGVLTYSWKNSVNVEVGATATVNNLPADTYTLTVIDNCFTRTNTVTISEPAALTLATSTKTDATCNATSTGSVTAGTVNNAVGVLTYSWKNSANVEVGTTVTVNNLPADTYTLTVTDDCFTRTNTVTIAEPAVLAVAETQTNVKCFGEATGNINISVAGGTSPYTYSWSNGSTSKDINNLIAGTYTINITDANGCAVSKTVTITQPTAPLSITETHEEVKCFGESTGNINISVTGGTLPYTYSWSNGSTTEDINNLLAGTYTVNITDANRCTVSKTITITQPTAPLSITETHEELKCFGESTGNINISVTGGTAPYTYNWSNGLTTEDINNLIAGTYTVNITDANGCAVSKTITITQPTAALSITETQTNVNCFGEAIGNINISVTGGTAPYTYNWNNGSTTEDLTNLTSGTYTINITDANGCTVSKTIIITQPSAPLSITETQTNVKCFGEATGNINISVAGGTSPYTYSWSNGSTTEDINNLIAGTYTVNITDANGCTVSKMIIITQPIAPLSITETQTNVNCFGEATGNINISVTGGTLPYTYSWSNGSTTEDLTNLIAGTYTVNITDANGCVISETITITQPTAPLSITEIHTNVSCFGGANGTINISVSGGKSPYVYSWSNGATTKDLSALAVGNYTLSVTDANNCVSVITVVVEQPLAPLQLTEVHQDITCFGEAAGSIVLTVNGGTAPYTFLWNNNAVSKDLSGLKAGIYSVVITDAKGCTIGKQIQVNQPAAPLTISETHQNINCFGEQTGSISINALGGTAPYTYSWVNGGTLQNLVNLSAGTYQVKVTDKNGCTAIKQIQIIQPNAPLTLSETHINNVCFGDKIAKIDVTVTGGTAPYTYLWNNGQTTQDLNNLGSGNYLLTVTDKNNCTQNISVSITPMQPFVIVETVQNVKCFNDNSGSISLNLSGGKAPYTVTWVNGASGPQINNLAAGNYTYKAVDAYGCTLQKTISITQPAPLAATLNITNTSCKFISDGAIEAVISGGTKPYSISWDDANGGIRTFANNQKAGRHTVRIVDANNCSILLYGVVLEGNCAPTADNDRYSTMEDTPITINTPGVIVNDNDPDQDIIKISLNTVKDPGAIQGTTSGNNIAFNTMNGSVTLNNEGSFTYTPKKNFYGTEKFVYKVSDGDLMSNFATVFIDVLAVNDPPVANDDNFITSEDIPVNGSVIANDSDPDADPLIYSLVNAPVQGALTFNSDGTFRYIPPANFSGIITFIYQVCDPSGACDQATVTITVSPVNDPPIAEDDRFKTEINKPVSQKVTDNDTDPDADPLQFSALTQPANGTLIFNTNGTFVYQPNPSFKGIDSFTYQACDPLGLCDNSTVTILVQPIVTVNLTPSTGVIKEGEKISITATLTQSILEDVTITLAFNGTATPNLDYTITGNYISILIPAGQTKTSQEFTINAINDALQDPGEQVEASITTTSSTFVLIGTGSTIAITDVYPVIKPTTPDENPDINPDPLVSPNQDGQGNERFIIYNISKYLDNEVLIFNRWGNEVYRVKGYNNDDKAFGGFANVGILTNANKELVDGVYYYIIYTTQNNARKLNKGYLILKR
ncbi:Ig-like domain-containing protein, partial [Pedobacter cryophilus]